MKAVIKIQPTFVVLTVAYQLYAVICLFDEASSFNSACLIFCAEQEMLHISAFSEINKGIFNVRVVCIDIFDLFFTAVGIL